MSMALPLPPRLILRDLAPIAALSVGICLAVSLLWVWFGGWDELPGVIGGLPYSLLLSVFTTVAATGFCEAAARLTRGRAAKLRWASYLLAMLLAAIAGTAVAATAFVLSGGAPPRAWLSIALGAGRTSILVTFAVGSAVMLIHEWRLREAALKEAGQVRRERVPSRIGGRVQLVDLADASYVYAQDKLTFAVTPARHHPLDLSIAELEQKLVGQGWLRIHRKTLVNPEAIEELRTDAEGRLFVRLADGGELRVARERAAMVRARLKGRPA